MPVASTSARSWIFVGLIVCLIAPPASAQSQPRQVAEGLNFANGLYRERRYNLAAEEYERFLKSGQPKADADVADAWFGLGNARLFLGRYADARKAFEEFLAVAPDHPNAPTARYRVGETAYVLGDLAEARRSLEAYATATTGDRRYALAAWSHLGDVAFRQDDLPAARKAYESALIGDPKGNLPDRARLGLGRVLVAQGEVEPALRAFRDLAAKGGPEWADKAWLEVGKVESGLGRWDRAVEAFEAVEKAAPGGPLRFEARVERAEALGHLGRSDEAERLLGPIADDPAQPLAAQAADALGSSWIARGKAAEALEMLDRVADRLATAANPAASTLRFRAAEASLALGRADDARGRFLKIAEGDPQSPSADDALLRASTLALDAKDPATALRLASGFAPKFPTSPLKGDAQLVEGRAALALGKAKDAIRALEAATTDGQPSPALAQAAYYYLGLAYQKDGQPAKSAEVFDRLTKAPASTLATDARFLLGQAHFEAGRFDEAIRALEQYRAEKPKGEVVDHALALQAQAEWAAGREEDAVKTLVALASAFPDRPLAAITAIRMGETAMASKKFDRAAELFRAGADLPQPTFQGRAKAGLGWALLQANRPAEAAEAFAGALGANPDETLFAEIAHAQARALEAAGNLDQAGASYQSVVDKAPKSPQAGPSALALARLSAERKNPAEAAGWYERTARDYPTTCGIPVDALLSEWGWALLDAGKPAEADSTFDRLIKEFPESPRALDARYNLAVSAFSAKDHARALDLLGPIVAEGSTARPALARSALNLIGRVRIEQADWAGASAAFARLIAEGAEGPALREARFWKAEVAFRSGDFTQADADFAGLASEAPVVGEFPRLAPTARARRVQCLAKSSRWDDAIAAAEAFRSAQPDDPLIAEVDFAEGLAYQGVARFEDARAAFDRVIAARKGGEVAARAQFLRGETYFHEKNYPDALREYYRVIIQYDAPEWRALSLLEAGKVHEKLDQWAEAVESYEKLRSQYPNDKNVEEATKRLGAARAKVAGSG